jgi:sialic acid synthase SpsE
MLACKRPGTGISPKFFEQILGRRTKVAIRADEVLHWEELD